MTGAAAYAAAVGLGLFGFLEPCTLGATALFLGYLRARSTAARVAALAVFTIVRLGLFAAFGAAAGQLGSRLTLLQQAGWLIIGAGLTAFGLLYLLRRQGLLKRRLGPAIERLPPGRGGLLAGLLFGLNVPACVTPLLPLAAGAAAGAGGPLHGALLLSVFALALSAPLLPLAAWPALAVRVDRLSWRLEGRMPRLLGAVMLALGLWSIALALAA